MVRVLKENWKKLKIIGELEPGGSFCTVCAHLARVTAVARVKISGIIYNACPVALYVANEQAREYVKERFNLGKKNADK